MASKYAEVHKSPNGPGDARPTALQIIKDEAIGNKWANKVILITGCSSGLGVETARALAETGATLYLTARDLEKARGALGSLADNNRVHLLQLDLNSLASVRACAAEFLSKSRTLNILICNAGVMTTPEGRTADGFETQLGVNHIAHFLFFHLLKPVLIISSTPEFNSRVVILSSIAHRFSEVNFDNINLDGVYDPLIAYGQSKTATLWTANEIERRYRSKGLHAWSVQPGAVDTGLMRHMPEDQKQETISDPYLVKIFKSPEQGAATTVWGATSNSLEGKGGKYLEDCQITEPWDPLAGEWAPGHASFAYDVGKATKLWDMSLEMVGIKD